MGIAAALTPRVRIMVICDAVRKSKTEPDVFTLKGVRQACRTRRLPFASRLSAYVLLSCSRGGIYPAYIRVVNDRTDRAVFQGNLSPHPEFDADGALLPLSIPMSCMFPEPGSYSVQFWFFQKLGMDVLKGEMPFFVAVDED